METKGLFASEQRFKLCQAILLYKLESTGNSWTYRSDTRDEDAADAVAPYGATVHDIALTDGRPVIMEGTPITFQALESLATGLGRQLDASILPSRIISISLSHMAWWCPAARRRIWFNPYKNHDHYQKLKALNGKFVQHPNLLFLARVGLQLQILALAENKRPEADTPVYRAPYFNLDESGHMCTGNVALPNSIGAVAMAQYEKAFFDSAYSHSNLGHQITAHPRGHVGLWQDMAQRKAPFPARHLVRRPKSTVQSIINHSLKRIR